MAPKPPISRSKPHSVFIAVMVCVLLLTSCALPTIGSTNGSTTVPPGPTAQVFLNTPTSIPPSPTPQVLPDTPTSIPPSPTPVPPTATATPIPPSSTPQLTATPRAPTGSYALSPGTTAGLVQGSIQAGQVVTYTIGAVQSQPLTLIMDSPGKDVTLGVSEPNGNVLLNPALKQTAWQTVLPSTELYTIKVIGGASKESYSLTVKIPQMVNFAPGATSMTLNGTTVNGYLYSYAVSCSVGQTMTVSLNVPSSTAVIDIYGLSGGTVVDASEAVNTWTGVLAQTQDYVIEVAPTHGQVVDYSLTVSVTAATASSLAAAGTVTFAPGTTAAVIQGTVQPGQVVTYTVQAGKAQPLILLLESPNTDVTLGVLNPDGTYLLNPANKWSYWQWQLPKTGQYTIQVIGGASTEKYTLTVKLGQLVYFDTEPKSVTLHGNTYPGYVVSYAFRLSAGLNMTVSLNTPSGEATIDIFGIETGSLLSFKEGATYWTGTLPETQEYVVEVVPRHGASTVYSLTVSIP
jgi:hypothetical protein